MFHVSVFVVALLCLLTNWRFYERNMCSCMYVYIYLSSRHSALLKVENNYCFQTRGPRSREYGSTLC